MIGRTGLFRDALSIGSFSLLSFCTSVGKAQDAPATAAAAQATAAAAQATAAAAPATAAAAPATAAAAPATAAAAANPEPSAQAAGANNSKSSEGATAQADVDYAKLLNSGQLLRYGVTGGVAAVVESPGLLGSKKNRLRAASAVAMPYLAVIPAYWFLDDDVAKACASPTWGTIDAVRNTKKTADTENGTDPDKKAADEKLWRRLRDKVKDRDSKCWLATAGVYLGVPGKFTTNVLLDNETIKASRDVRPVFSAGLIFVPHTYLHALVGVTMSNILGDKASATSLTPAADQRSWSWNVGLGGPLDILAALITGSSSSGASAASSAKSK